MSGKFATGVNDNSVNNTGRKFATCVQSRGTVPLKALGHELDFKKFDRKV
jgi:hypothetical protein